MGLAAIAYNHSRMGRNNQMIWICTYVAKWFRYLLIFFLITLITSKPSSNKGYVIQTHKKNGCKHKVINGHAWPRGSYLGLIVVEQNLREKNHHSIDLL